MPTARPKEVRKSKKMGFRSVTLAFDLCDFSLLYPARYVHLFGSPSPPFTLLDRPTPSCSFRTIKLNRWLGAGAIWDTYLASAGPMELVVKLSCPDSCARASGRDVDQIERQIKHEISLYTGRLKSLQGIVVPTLEAVGVCTVPWQRGQGKGKGGGGGGRQVWLMLMEYVGEPMGVEQFENQQ